MSSKDRMTGSRTSGAQIPSDPRSMLLNLVERVKPDREYEFKTTGLQALVVCYPRRVQHPLLVLHSAKRRIS
jgi:hypothetical protein